MEDASFRTSTPDRASDAALLARVASGDMAAMKALSMTNAGAIGRFVRTRVRDEVEVADIVHDAMLKVWRGAAGFEGRSSVLSWILALARNGSVDHIRKQARVSLGDADERIPDGDPDPEAVLGEAQDAARLRACVEEPPERQRAAIHLAFFQEMTLAEVARIESVAEGTVKSRVFHARQLLMRRISRGGWR